MLLDTESCYRAVKGRDRRFDGVFYTAVSSTGIYCRPSCTARTPAYRNVSFHPTAASAQAAGYRACKRCRPDATPGSPDWDVAADTAGRAMRLIADGVVDRDGVDGLADRLGYSSRHLNRMLSSELGAGPLALARARRAQTARILIEGTDMGFADVAFASGFASVRQFNDTVREVYDVSPTALRGGRRRSGHPRPAQGRLRLRLAVRTPFDGPGLLTFLAAGAVPGVERVDGSRYSRTLDLPHGPGVVEVDLPLLEESGGTSHLLADFTLTDLRDTSAAVERTRRLLDADADPLAVTAVFVGDPVLGPLRRSRPGLRIPGHPDGGEGALRAVLGQQVSLAAARTAAAKLSRSHGVELPEPVAGLTHLSPRPAALAGLDPADLPMPRSRGAALIALCRALASTDGGERLDLDRGAARDDVRERLLALPGIGPWTADVIALRSLGDPDVLLPTDLATRRALTVLAERGVPVDPADVVRRAERWRPWRSYAQLHLWISLVDLTGSFNPRPTTESSTPRRAVPCGPR